MTTELQDLRQLVKRECVPAEVFRVEAEHATLPAWSETPWAHRYMPRGVTAAFRGMVNTTAPGALDVSTLVVRDAQTRKRLLAERDYVVHPTFASLCLPSDSSLNSRDVVISYRFSHLRLDSIVRSPTDGLDYVRGMNSLTAPHPADPEGIANVYVPYFGDATSAEIWPVTISSRPRAVEPDRSQGDLRILFLGDSVTQGAEATSEQTTFREVALRALRDRFPYRGFTAVTAAVGGSNSSEWLGDDRRWDWGIVERSGADLAIVEFVNDAGQPESSWLPNYDEIRRRLGAQGCAVILTTPPFTMPSMMGDEARSGVDRRSYVRFVRDYARQHGLPLADVSRGWEGLIEQGIPYWTMLANGINHPDDRGHELAGLIVADAVAATLSSGRHL